MLKNIKPGKIYTAPSYLPILKDYVVITKIIENQYVYYRYVERPEEEYIISLMHVTDYWKLVDTLNYET